MTFRSNLKLKEKSLELEEEVNVCSSCLKFLVMQGVAKDAFIVRLNPLDLAEIVECDVCKENEGKIVISSFERGLYICKNCLEERGKKHNWNNNFKLEETKGETKCDLCLSKGAKHLKKAKDNKGED